MVETVTIAETMDSWRFNLGRMTTLLRDGTRQVLWRNVSKI